MRRVAAAAFLFVSVFFATDLFAAAPVQDEPDAPVPAVSGPKSRISVEIKDDLLSVDLADADFSSVLNAISAKSGIKVEISGDFGKKRLNTKFSGVELERGIIRLMTLMKEKNYMMKYDTKGRVNLIEVYASAPAPAPSSKSPAKAEPPKTAQPFATKVEKPVSGLQKNPPQQQRLIPPPGQSASQNSSQKAAKDVKKTESEEEDSDVEELPYIPPQKRMPVKP